MKVTAKQIVRLPRLVQLWLVNYEAWLVGSSVRWLLAGTKDPSSRDFDVVIPPKHWQAACSLVQTPVRLNTFGGLKTLHERKGTAPISIDFWPMHLEDFLAVRAGDITCEQALRFSPFSLVTVTR